LGLAGVAERTGDLSEAHHWFLKATENLASQHDPTVLLEMARQGILNEVGRDSLRAQGNQQVNIFLHSRASTEVDRLRSELEELRAEVKRLYGEMERQRIVLREAQSQALHFWRKPADSVGRTLDDSLDDYAATEKKLDAGGGDPERGLRRDELALRRDQEAVLRDFSAAVIKVLISIAPGTLTALIPPLIARENRSNIQFTVQMQVTPSLDEEEISSLAADLKVRYRSLRRPSDDDK
jgi:hypothetical protein